MRFLQKLTIVVLALCLLLTCFACKTPDDNPNTTDERPEGTDLIIYMASDIVSGTNDNKVKEAIEQKFWEDTGISIDLKMQLKSKADFAEVMGTTMASGAWDAAVSYMGHAGVDDSIMREGYSMRLNDLLNRYGSNIKKVVGNEGFYAVTDPNDDILAIPSTDKTKKYGILVRKDYMTTAGYTEQPGNPDGLKTVRTIDDFEDMLRAMKQKVSKIGDNPALLGYPWDLETVLTSGAFGGAFYDSRKVLYNTDGSVKEVVPGYILDEYENVLQYAYRWQKDKLWEADAQNRPVSSRQNAFITGTAGVYVVNPEVTYLIRVARMVQELDPNAEFVMLDPLYGVDEEGNETESRGFKEDSPNYSALVLNPRSQNTELVIKYLDWMYSDVENYELCAYGIEGQDWVDVGDGLYGYPKGKEDEYIRNPSYSKCFMLVKQENFSYRILDSYTEEEKGWLTQMENAPTFKSDVYGYYFTKASQEAATAFSVAQNEMFSKCLFTAWAGTNEPKYTFDTYVSQFRNTAGEYIKHITDQYKLYTAERS